MTATEDISSAERLIRALRRPEAGEDEPAWVARWTAELDEATIEDAQSAVADLTQQLARIQDRLTRTRAVENKWGIQSTLVENGTRASTLIHIQRLRQAQMRVLRMWIRDQEKLEDKLDRQVRHDKQLAHESAGRSKRELAMQQSELNAMQQKTAADVREYKRAIWERERALARARIASVITTVPDASDAGLIVQAANHVILRLRQKLFDAGVEQPLDDHEQNLWNAIGGWLSALAIEQAVASVDAQRASTTD